MAVRLGAPAGSQRWPRSVLWKLGSFLFLILLETIDCLANPSYLPDNNHNPSVNIYMGLEEVKKLLGKDAAGLRLLTVRAPLFGPLRLKSTLRLLYTLNPFDSDLY